MQGGPRDGEQIDEGARR